MSVGPWQLIVMLIVMMVVGTFLASVAAGVYFLVKSQTGPKKAGQPAADASPKRDAANAPGAGSPAGGGSEGNAQQ